MEFAFAIKTLIVIATLLLWWWLNLHMKRLDVESKTYSRFHRIMSTPLPTSIRPPRGPVMTAVCEAQAQARREAGEWVARQRALRTTEAALLRRSNNKS